MTSKPTALFLSPESPHPPIGGGPLRSASVLHYLLSRYEVDAVLFRQPDGPPPQCPGAARTLTIPLPFHSRQTLARLWRNASRVLRGAPPLIDRFAGFEPLLRDFLAGRRYDLGLVEHLWLAPYCEILRPVCARLVLDLHNIESEWHRRCAAAESPVTAAAMYRFAWAARRIEANYLPRFDLVLATSEEDASRASAIAPEAKLAVFPNVLPPIEPRPRVDDGRSLVFPGNLEYLPNRQAIRWFHTQVWPRLRHRPGLVWRILGCHPEAVPPEIRADPAIEIGPLGEDSISRLAEASVGIAPLISGSGTRLKILEMWAAGLPVVSTPLGAEGLGAVDGFHIAIADTPQRFAAAVVKLLESPEQRQQFGEAGRALLRARFTWEAGWERLRGLGL